mgnify:CR=1 FL=1
MIPTAPRSYLRENLYAVALQAGRRNTVKATTATNSASVPTGNINSSANATSALPKSMTPTILKRCLTEPTPAVTYGRTKVTKTNPVNNASTKVAGGYTSSTKPRKANRHPTARNAATPASPDPAHGLSMCLGQSVRWVAKPSVALGWHGQYSASASKQPYITCGGFVRSKKAELYLFEGQSPKNPQKCGKTT